MKRTALVLVFATALFNSHPVNAGTELANNPPKAYGFSYQTASNGRIVENSVCKEYGGLDWKGCRRYAQWKFSVQCWNLGYDIKHSSGPSRQKIKQQLDFFCDAKRRVTPLR